MERWQVYLFFFITTGKLMKTIIMKTLLLSCSILFLSITLQAQQSKDNAIIIPKAGVTEDKIMMALISEGFPVVFSNKYYLAAPVQRNVTMIRVAIYAREDSYVLHGWYDDNMASVSRREDYQLISYGGSKLSIKRRSWNELIKVAEKISKSYTFAAL
jgi:hypothetical protein